MKLLISSSQHFPTYKIPSFPRHHNPIFTNFNHFPNTLLNHFPKLLLTTSFSSHSPNFNGWFNPESPPNSTHLTRLLSSLGVHDRKYLFVYLLGFVCALAVSRVRVSYLVVIPVSFLVFAFGFSFGAVNASGFKSDFKKVDKKVGKDVKNDEFRVLVEGLRGLGDMLSGFDDKIVNLKEGMRKCVEFGRVSKRDLVGFIDGVDVIGDGVVRAKSMVDGFMDGGGVAGSTNDVSKVLDKKGCEKKGFGFSEFVAGFGTRGGKVKDGSKNDLEASESKQVKVVDPVVEDETVGSMMSGDVGVKETYIGKGMGSMEMDSGSERIFEREEYFVKSNKSRFVKSERMPFEMNDRSFGQTWESDDDMLDLDFGSSRKQRRGTEEYFQQEQAKYRKVDGNNMLYDDMESDKNKVYDESRNGNGFASSPSLDMSNDMLFNEYVTEANELLKQSREWLTQRGIEEDAENMLFKSTDLLSKAVDMKPMSLLAVGQLGNTYLLHGELKLKLSRKLRHLLAQSDSNVLESLDDVFSNREKFVDHLVNVCEECEELLVKAGRKYRLALSIDANDMRALYNWGLALSFRAQLIADIGPGAAFDADKVYMAAIDKFNAMMSKSNSHTPDALFRWGVALQQRSRLRTRNFREKVKLLSQAKRLYEDALLMDSSNLQVKEALSTCVSELRYKNYY